MISVTAFEKFKLLSIFYYERRIQSRGESRHRINYQCDDIKKAVI